MIQNRCAYAPLITAVCWLLLIAMAPSAWALNQEIWTMYQARTIARIDAGTGAFTVFGTGMIDPARPLDPPGGDWTTIAIAPDATLYLMRRNQAGAVWLYSVPSYNIVVTGNTVTNLAVVGSTGLSGNIDGLAVGPDGNVYFTAYSVTGGAAANGLYRYRLGLNIVEYVGTFLGNAGSGQANSFYTDLTFEPGPNGDLIGQGKPTALQFGLYKIPRTAALSGTNQLFPYTAFSTVALGGDRRDGIAFDPTNGNPFLAHDGQGVSRVDAQGDNPVLIPGTRPDLGWDLANQVEGCSSTRVIRTLCDPHAPGTYTFTFEITNNSNITAYSWTIPNSPPFTFSPHTQPFNPPLPPGGTQQVTITVYGAAAGQQVCLRGVLLGETGDECCKFQICTTIPECDCLQIVRDFAPHCTGSFNGSFTYTFQIQNLEAYPFGHLFIQAPAGVTVTPDYFALTPAVAANGGIDSLLHTVTISGATPGTKLCFDVTVLDSDLNECCTKQICIDVPNCHWWWWNHLELTTDAGIGFGGADVSRTPPGAGAAGFSVNARPASPALVADEFTVEKPSAIHEIAIPAYVERSGTREPFDFLGIEIWDGPPNAAASQRIYGDVATNVLRGATPAGTYRVLYDEPNTTDRRPVWLANAPLSRAVVLQPGTYWLVWTLGSPIGAPMQPYKVTRTAVKPGDALLRVDGTWTRAIAGEAWPDGTTLPFQLRLGVLPAAKGIVLNTGYDPLLESALPLGVLPNGTTDDLWQIVSPGETRPAKVVIAAPENWPDALQDSRWISADPNRGTSLPDVSRISFQRCFCLGDKPGAVTLDLELLADNSASVFLNDHLLAGPGGAFNDASLAVRRVGAVGDGLFVLGRNCLRVEVADQGFFTGLDLTGSVEAPEGCEP